VIALTAREPPRRFSCSLHCGHKQAIDQPMLDVARHISLRLVHLPAIVAAHQSERASRA